jgi:hypothetical protein
MASYNRRAEGQRVPYRGRSDRQRAGVFGEVREEESAAPEEGRSHRVARERQRQREESHVRSPDRKNWS